MITNQQCLHNVGFRILGHNVTLTLRTAALPMNPVGGLPSTLQTFILQPPSVTEFLKPPLPTCLCRRMAGVLHEVVTNVVNSEDSVCVDFGAEHHHGQCADTLDYDGACPHFFVDDSW